MSDKQLDITEVERAIVAERDHFGVTKMVQPDVAEVERLMDAFSASCNSVQKFGHITSFKPMGQQIVEHKEARAALLDAVRAIVAERDALAALSGEVKP